MLMTNNEIYNTASKLLEYFQDNSQYLPIKINFYLQKNKATLVSLAQEIENARRELIHKYGSTGDSATEFIIPTENIEQFTQESNDLFNIQQDVNIYTININDLDNSISLTTGQMQAIMFMIE